VVDVIPIAQAAKGDGVALIERQDEKPTSFGFSGWRAETRVTSAAPSLVGKASRFSATNPVFFHQRRAQRARATTAIAPGRSGCKSMASAYSSHGVTPSGRCRKDEPDSRAAGEQEVVVRHDTACLADGLKSTDPMPHRSTTSETSLEHDTPRDVNDLYQ